MLKSELKDGDKLILRNNEVFYYNGFSELGIYNNNLIHFNEQYGRPFDIVKVERIQIDENTFNGITNEYLTSSNVPLWKIFNSNLIYMTIWSENDLLEKGDE